MSQSKDNNKKKSFVGGSGGGGGGGSGGYNSPKHGNNNNNNNRNNNNNNKSPHQSHNNQSQQQQSQQSQQQQQQPYDSLTAMKDRTVFMSMSLVGQMVSVTLKNGDIYDGILHTTSTNTGGSIGGGWGIALKMARKRDTSKTVITTPPLPLVIIESKDFLQLTATGVILDHYKDSFMNRDQQTFITDTELSGFDGNLKERELTPWTPDPSIGESLDDFASNSEAKKPANWDQFETNEKLFGVRTTYEEELYTTRLDRDSEFYKSNQSAAEKKAAEIENEKSGNIHLLEERGFIEGADYDEEERYSSVVRKGLIPNSTTSPAATTTTSTTTTASTGSVYIPPSKRGGSTSTSPPIVDKKQQPQPQQQEKKSNEQSTPKTPLSSNTSSTTSSTPSTPTTPKTLNNSTNTTTNVTINNSPSTGDKESSPNVSKLRLQHQSTIEQEAMSSPRENLSPRSVAYTRYRSILSDPANKSLKTSGSNISTSSPNGSVGGSGSAGNGVGPNGTPLLSSVHSDQAPKSPAPTIVSNHHLVKALSLELATPVVPERVVNDFNNFKLKLNNVDRGSETQDLKSFSSNLVIKSKSRPGSPLIGSGSPRPTPTQLSLSGTNLNNIASNLSTSTNNTATTTATTTPSTTATVSEDSTSSDKKSTTTTENNTTTDQKTAAPTTTATTEEKSSEKKDESTTSTATPSTTTTSTPLKPLSKLKLNPNAKEFVPVVVKPAATPTYVKSTPESNTDSITPINEIYYESMRKKQMQPESPYNVSLYWDPIIRYEEDMYAYPPHPQHMRATHMGPPPPHQGGIPLALHHPSQQGQFSYPPPPPGVHMVAPPQLAHPPGVVHGMKPPGGGKGMYQGQPTIVQGRGGHGHPPPPPPQHFIHTGLPPGNLNLISPNGGPPNAHQGPPPQFVFAQPPPHQGHPPPYGVHQYAPPPPPQSQGKRYYQPQGPYTTGPPPQMIMQQQGVVPQPPPPSSSQSPPQPGDSPNSVGQRVPPPYQYMNHGHPPPPPRGYHPNENQYH